MNSQIVDFFDATYLKTADQAHITTEQDQQFIETFVMEAIEHQYKLVMIRPYHISLAKKLIASNKSHVLVGTVIDFPLGKSPIESKLIEIDSAIGLGADDIDIVLNYEKFKEADIDAIKDEVFQCTQRCLEHQKTVKWIIESAALTDDEIQSVCQLIKDCVLRHFGKEKANQVFVKSSTGFFVLSNGTSGGATKDAIKMMIKHAHPLPVKASGGIRNRDDFDAMIKLGVSRIGTSSALHILQGTTSDSQY